MYQIVCIKYGAFPQLTINFQRNLINKIHAGWTNTSVSLYTHKINTTE